MNFYAGLPNDLATRVRRLLEPHVFTAGQRIGLISEAFFLADQRIGRSIEYDGTPLEFARTCTNHLLQNVVCLEGSEQHSVSRLLQVVRDQCGITDQALIDEVVAMLDPRCRENRTVEEPKKPSIPPASLPEEPLQTEKTPLDRRTPTVFVSYSHRDSRFAERVIEDLQRAGHAVWIDVDTLKGGDDWVRAIAEGILNSYAFVIIVTPDALDSSWVQDEILWAKQRQRLIIPLILDVSVLEMTGFFALNRYQGIRFDTGYDAALPELLAALPSPSITPSATNADSAETVAFVAQSRPRTQRESELEYLDRLRLEVLLNTERYTALAGKSQFTHDRSPERIASVVMRPEFALLGNAREQTSEIRRFDDAVAEILELRRVAVLGEPGAGKTTTLWRLASDLAQKAIDDPAAPIPLVIRLGKWIKAGQKFRDFIRQELGNLGSYLRYLLSSGRAALLFDGLNEIPVSQRKGDQADKDGQVKRFIDSHASLLAVVSCRVQDYKDLGFYRIEIQPLDPARIRDFLTRYLDPPMGAGTGERLFWQMVGGAQLEQVWDKWQRAGVTFEQFFASPDTPRETPNVYDATSFMDHRVWRERLRKPGSLLLLARNPYFLTMLAQVYQNSGSLPQNRGELFRRFVSTLFAREKIIEVDKQTGREIWPDDAVQLLRELSEVAFAMQQQRSRAKGDADAATSLPLERVRKHLTESELYLAGSASILSVGDSVRFTHQLLQEYFAAVALRGRVFAQYGPETTYVANDGLGLKATELWKPDRWWERTNWEETAVLFAGLYPDDCTPVITWLMDANPEVAADCIVRSGAKIPDATLLRLRKRWIPRLTDLQADPSPLARAAIGHVLDMLKLEGEPLDNRKGVSVIKRKGVVLPDIDWVPVPGGEFVYQKDQRLTLPTFEMARYPLTYAQFEAFVDDAEDFSDPRWWDGLADDEYRRDNQRAPGEQGFQFWNHPRETVSWYDAMAFCRWFSWRLGGGYDMDKVTAWAVRLPTEYEWEKAARGKHGLNYPYANDFDATKGNTGETGIGQTSAVGIFPDGASPGGLLDMSGNVWQWCLTDYEKPDLDAARENLGSDARRVLRGGSWNYFQGSARAASRFCSFPYGRNSYVGFRLVRPPSPGSF